MIETRDGNNRHAHRNDGSWKATYFGWYLPHQIAARQSWGHALSAEIDALVKNGRLPLVKAIREQAAKAET